MTCSFFPQPHTLCSRAGDLWWITPPLKQKTQPNNEGSYETEAKPTDAWHQTLNASKWRLRWNARGREFQTHRVSHRAISPSQSRGRDSAGKSRVKSSNGAEPFLFFFKNLPWILGFKAEKSCLNARLDYFRWIQNQKRVRVVWLPHRKVEQFDRICSLFTLYGAWRGRLRLSGLLARKLSAKPSHWPNNCNVEKKCHLVCAMNMN